MEDLVTRVTGSTRDILAAGALVEQLLELVPALLALCAHFPVVLPLQHYWLAVGGARSCCGWGHMLCCGFWLNECWHVARARSSAWCTIQRVQSAQSPADLQDIDVYAWYVAHVFDAAAAATCCVLVANAERAAQRHQHLPCSTAGGLLHVPLRALPQPSSHAPAA
jgi:hypothetical protein